MTNIYKDDVMQEGIKALARLMKESDSIVVLTGAGMDTESNIPDFRGKDGLWRKIDPRLVASVDTLEENYYMFREFYIERINRLKDVA
ncbi:MAG: NAD-dependent protein deacylase, partial [Tissierellia bacterium]|nr:NAD-dependent protein deacylase [Tissierellia bacterium]